MVLWSAWIPDILPHVAGCPIPIVEHELRRAAQEFFERTRAWKVQLAAVPVTSGTQEVAITVADAAEQVPVWASEVWYDGLWIRLATTEDLFARDRNWPTRTGVPSEYTQLTPGSLRLYPIPSANAVTGLTCLAAIKPADTATGIPDALRVKFRQAIASGAKSRLFAYPGKPWSSPEMAKMFRDDFDAEIDKATLAATRAFGRGRMPSSVTWC